MRLGSRRTLAVAVLGSEEIDVTAIDSASLGFGPADAEPRHDLTDPRVRERHLRDVDGDGWLDHLSHYPIAKTGIDLQDTEACLWGRIGNESFRACDEVIPVFRRSHPRHPPHDLRR